MALDQYGVTGEDGFTPVSAVYSSVSDATTDTPKGFVESLSGYEGMMVTSVVASKSVEVDLLLGPAGGYSMPAKYKAIALCPTVSSDAGHQFIFTSYPSR